MIHVSGWSRRSTETTKNRHEYSINNFVLFVFLSMTKRKLRNWTWTSSNCQQNSNVDQLSNWIYRIFSLLHLVNEFRHMKTEETSKSVSLAHLTITQIYWRRRNRNWKTDAARWSNQQINFVRVTFEVSRNIDKINRIRGSFSSIKREKSTQWNSISYTNSKQWKWLINWCSFFFSFKINR